MMTYVKILGLGMLVAAGAMTGCSSQPNPPKPTAKNESGHSEEHHEHGVGPNGGVIFDLGKYHAEFTVDHDKKECAVHFIEGDDAKAKPLAVAAKELTATTKDTQTKDGKKVPPITVKLLPADESNGKATKFVGTDAGFGNVADFNATVIGEIDGKPSKGEAKEGDHDEHKK